jgi:hypothetical protein
MEKAEIINLLQGTLKAISSSKGSGTRSLLRKMLSVFIIVTKYALQRGKSLKNKRGQGNQGEKEKELIPKE